MCALGLTLCVCASSLSFMARPGPAGSPTEETWPGIQSNEDFLSYRFDHCAPQSLIHRAPRLDGDGLDLLNKFLCVSTRSPLSRSLWKESREGRPILFDPHSSLTSSWFHRVTQYEAKKRISAQDAMRHPYFRSLGSMVHKLPDSKSKLYPPTSNSLV